MSTRNWSFTFTTMSVAVYCWNPGAVTVTLYVPGGIARIRYDPSTADTVSRLKFVSALVATTRAPATTACVASCTTPKIEPVTSAQRQLEKKVKKLNNTPYIERRKRRCIDPRPPDYSNQN